jgi:hypothetical protein
MPKIHSENRTLKKNEYILSVTKVCFFSMAIRIFTFLWDFYFPNNKSIIFVAVFYSFFLVSEMRFLEIVTLSRGGLPIP